MDDPKKRDVRDRSKINMQQFVEVKCWGNELSATVA